MSTALPATGPAGATPGPAAAPGGRTPGDPVAGPDQVHLDVADVGISFRGVRALDGVCLAVRRGGITAVIGPNGAGKTTLFNCVSGLHRHEGTIGLDGRDLAGVPPHARAALGLQRTFQTPALLDEASALDNVLVGTHPHTRAGFAASLLGLARVRREERAARDDAHTLLAALGVAALSGRATGSLAHGDRRRVEVARVLAGRPRLLLLDEPAAGLGSAEAADLLARVAVLAQDLTMVLIEHDVALVMSVAHTVAVLDFGRVIATGPPAAVAADPAVVAAYLGQEDTA